MDREEFWKHIQASNDQSGGDMDQKCELIKSSISEMSTEEAAAFSDYFDAAMHDSYTWDLWGAAYVINGGCGDDTFSDFRSSLISRGKNSFEQAVANPESLAGENFDEEAWFFEGFQYAVHEGVEAVAGSEALSGKTITEEPSGEQWEEDPEALRCKYPELWVKFEHVWRMPDKSAQVETKPWWKFW
jgi:hypothetical protein